MTTPSVPAEEDAPAPSAEPPGDHHEDFLDELLEESISDSDIFGDPITDTDDPKTSVQRIRDFVGSHEFKKMMRYSAVSLVFVPLGQAMVQGLKWFAHWHGSAAVLMTACLLTPPNFLANKHYVWRHKNRENLRNEALVFWLSAVLGTVFAMGCTALAEAWFPESRGELANAIAVFLAQAVGYGVVWVGRYIFLDKLVFTVTHHEESVPGVGAPS